MPHRTPWLTANIVLVLCACSGGNSTDAGADANGIDAPVTPTTIAQLPIASTSRIAGLDGTVDVVVDRQGWPHIYATTLRDAMYVQGILVARDRMPQMELLRRLSSGLLAEAFGQLSASTIESDISMRTVGLRRAAQAMWDATPPGRSRVAGEAFAAGINQFLGEIRDGLRRVPSGTEIVVNDGTPDWTPVDSLTIGRYQSFSLSYDAGSDVVETTARDNWRQAFDLADMATAPENARRAGAYWDVFRFAAPSTAQVVPGFYSTMGMGLTFRPPVLAPRMPVSLAQNTTRFFERVREAAQLYGFGRNERGSNNWIVSASGSANGHALLANDPHLSLTSPAVWWGSHIVIATGPDAVDVTGVTFPGIPGVVLGHNRYIAWGGTVADFDVTDVFQETITPGTGGMPDTVSFMGRQVPIMTITERIPNGNGGTYDAPIEIVPHHGPIIPTIRMGRIQPRTGTTALSVRWTGHRPTQDFEAFLGLLYAHNVADARRALDNFGVGAQNWVIADVEGNTGYTTSSVVPQRAAGALTWTPTSTRGTLPCYVLPGTGEAEWVGEIPRNRLPNGMGTPARPWIATANNDQAGLAQDNNPANDPVFLNCRWTYGWRAERIQQRLTMLNNRVRIEDMQDIQADHVLLIGGRFRPFIQSAMMRLSEEWATAGTNPDLSAVAISLRPREMVLRDALARLMAWSLDAAAGVDYDTTEQSQRDAIATSLFHAWLRAATAGAFADESTASGGPGGGADLVALLYILEHPDQLVARDPMTGQSVLWDDISTAATHESRDTIIVNALDRATRDAERLFMSADPTQWLWGRIHTVRFGSVVPGPGSVLSVPPPGDTMFPNGFPRPGGIDSVDVAFPGANGSFGGGASMRFTVDLDPAGPHAWNSIPGGQVFNTQSRHHRDLAELWRRNQVFPIPRTEPEVVAAFESRLRFEPMR